jgi:glutaminyl-peptide cyclotransferase
VVLKSIGIALLAVVAMAASPACAAPEYGYQVVHTYPHDRQAFTEGLFYLDGYLYESTGEEGRSGIRKEKLETGQVVMSRNIAPAYFGEGIVAWKDRLYELTWRNQIGFIYDLATFTPFAKFEYQGEGWALTQDGKRLIMSDGTPELRFLDPDTLKETGRIRVTDNGKPVGNLNELEYVKGEVFANVWQTNRIARIDPKSGHVTGWIDLTGLLPAAENTGGPDAVLNGIAYDAKGDRLFVTGKMWPKLFEIRLAPKTPPKPSHQHRRHG